MNWITAAEALIAIQAKAAQGADDDDGVVIADDDLLAIGEVARELLAEARMGARTLLPTVNIDTLIRVATQQALEQNNGAIGPTAAALGVSTGTLWNWRKRWRREDRAKAAWLDRRVREDHDNA